MLSEPAMPTDPSQCCTKHLGFAGGPCRQPCHSDASQVHQQHAQTMIWHHTQTFSCENLKDSAWCGKGEWCESPMAHSVAISSHRRCICACAVCPSWAEARIKIARMTLTVKLNRNWSSFQLANCTPPLSVTGSTIAPSTRMRGEVPSEHRGQ